MNKKQAMRLAKKMEAEEAARAAMAEEQKKREEFAKEYPIYDFTCTLRELEMEDDGTAGIYMVDHWPAVRDALNAQRTGGQKLDFDKVHIRMPEDSKEKESMLQMDFVNVMNECDMFLLNADKYEEMIPIFRELLEMRDLSDDQLTRDNYISAIGEAYDSLGRKEERDRIFEEQLSQGRNDYLAAKYASLLLDAEELDKAEKLMADYEDSKDELMLYQFEYLKDLKRKKESKA